MSWFDSSFTFAKSALNQAQKSIDRVLDIKDDDVQDHLNSVSTPSSSTPSSAQTPHVSNPAPKHSDILSKASQKSKHSKNEKIKSKSDKSFIQNSSTSSSDGFSSTWGGMDSFWSTSFSGDDKTVHNSPIESARRGVGASKSAESPKGTPLAKTGGIGSFSMQGRVTSPTLTSTPMAVEHGGIEGAKKEETPHRGEQTSHPPLSDPDTPTTNNTEQRILLTNSNSNSEAEISQQQQQRLLVGVDDTDNISITNSEAEKFCQQQQQQQSIGITDSISTTVDIGDGDSNNPSRTEQGMIGSITAEGTEIGIPNTMESITTSPTLPVSAKNDTTQNTVSNSRSSTLESVDHDRVNSRRTKKLTSSLASEVKVHDEGCSDVVVDFNPITSPSLDIPPIKQKELDRNDIESTTLPSPIESSTAAIIPSEIECSNAVMNMVTDDEPIDKNNGGDGGLISEAVTEQEKVNDPLPPLDRLSSQQSEDHEQIRKELLHAQHVLNIREQKIVDMSHEIIGLMETNQTLQAELDMAKEAGESDVEKMREEFTKRIGMSEKKLQAVLKERESLKKQLTALQNEQTLQKRTEGGELSKVLKEKEEQIAQLMEEGEKLSKQELQSNGIIKKLRSKERQNDQLLAAQRQQIEDLESKIKNLKDQIKKKEENEKKYQESLGQLNIIAEQQAKELTNLKTERDESLEKIQSLYTNLDNSYKELANLQKTNAVTQNAAQEAVATVEKSKQEEFRVVLEQQKTSFKKEKESLIMQIEELRMGVSRAEQQLAWREDRMKQEVADIQKRLQEAEDRNQELTSTISQATKPLLRQIENLQSAHLSQTTNWEKVEASLTQRLVDSQAQLNVALEKERSAVEKEMTLKSRVTALESQLSNIRQEKSQLLATVELEKAKLETLEEGQHRDSAKLEALRTSYQQSMDELKKEKEMLERQLEYERVRLEAESRKACLESQEKERLRSQLANSLSSINRTLSHQSSIGSQSDILDKSLQVSESGSTSELSYGMTPSKAGSASALEHFQSLLRQKEGELTNIQNLASSLERSRTSMAEELVRLSAQNEVLSQQVKNIPQLEKELKEVRQKHETMLQMYGEKAEEAEELKLDIQDLKIMYRQQIDELVSGRRL